MTILAAAALSYNRLVSANELLREQVKTAEAQLSEHEAEALRLAQDIESIEAINQQLLDERERLAKIEQRYQATTEQLISELHTAQQAVNELRQSQHEEVKTWANTRVPDSALRLLRNTRAEGSDPHSDDDYPHILDTAGEPFSPVHGTRFDD